MTTDYREPMSGGGWTTTGQKETPDFSITAQSKISHFSCSILKSNPEPLISSKFVFREIKVTAFSAYPLWTQQDSPTECYSILPLPEHHIPQKVEKLLMLRFLEMVEGNLPVTIFTGLYPPTNTCTGVYLRRGA